MNFNKFNDPEQETIKNFANRRERTIAKKLKAKQTINSGMFNFDKADIKLKGVRIDVKSTNKNQIIINKEWLKKIEKDCKINEVPAICLDIQEEQWFVVRKSEFDLITEIIGKENGNKNIRKNI